jgi:hypothetical protein
LKHVATLTNLYRQGLFNLMDVFVQLPAQICQTMCIFRLKDETLGLLFSGHAARLIPPESHTHIARKQTPYDSGKKQEV